MKYSNAIKTLKKEGFEIIDQTHWVLAIKEGHRKIEVMKNGREDAVASIKVGHAYPNTLKRAIQLSGTLAGM